MADAEEFDQASGSIGGSHSTHNQQSEKLYMAATAI